MDKPKEECGIFGIYGISEAANYVYLGLNFLQHRGQESCGIVSTEGISLYKQVGVGKISEFLDDEKLNYLKGFRSIGHVRYSTTGSPTLVNAQPITGSTSKGAVAIAHNGNITNANLIRNELIKQGKVFHSTSDSEVVIHLISEAPPEDLVEAVKWALSKLEGSFALLIMTKDTLIAARDPMGFRPLSMGKIGDTIADIGGTIAFSSEDSAFSIIEAKKLREVEPNEMVIITENGIRTDQIIPVKPKTNQCVFELIYFAKPSSNMFHTSVYEYRLGIGRKLARLHPVDADYVVPVPDSGMVSAIGYSMESGIPLGLGLIRSHFIGRTFIEPSQKIRDFGVKMKFIPVPEIIAGKRIILIDDSVVRGTTSKKIVKLVRNYGPKEVHMRVASPPVRFPCFYGIDFSTYEELLANKYRTMDEIAAFIGVETVGYLDTDALFTENDSAHMGDFCAACFDGKYPSPLNQFSKDGFEQEIKQKYFGNHRGS
ncbi:MAG: amidophosphoribosyltransferase [Brevinematales bacterium]|nr:amidophosphoribosyltransferase [Brevinematales bacterium]